MFLISLSTVVLLCCRTAVLSYAVIAVITVGFRVDRHHRLVLDIFCCPAAVCSASLNGYHTHANHV